jgi:hypothetical protein
MVKNNVPIRRPHILPSVRRFRVPLRLLSSLPQDISSTLSRLAPQIGETVRDSTECFLSSGQVFWTRL